MLLALTASLVAWHRSILRWHSVVCVVLAVVLFIPIGRFTLPVNLPIGLEPYRIVVALVLAAWAGSLLVDPAVRLRRSPLDAPILVVVSASLGSVLVNFHRVIPLEGAVLKGVTFFLSFVLVYYFIVCVVVTRSAIETVTRFFVGGVAFIAASAIVEQRTHFNVFDHAASFLPFLQFQGGSETVRGGVVRAIGPAQHPIALGVLFAMAIPIGVALARGSHRRWWIPTAMISIGLLASTSRTPILSVVVAGLVLFALRPREMVRLLPLVVPLSLVINFAVPGSIATVKDSFFPKGGLVEQQTVEARYSDPLLAGGRIRQLGPMLAQASRTPATRAGNGNAADRFRQSASKRTHPRQPMARVTSRGRRDRRPRMGLVDRAVHPSPCAREPDARRPRGLARSRVRGGDCQLLDRDVHLRLPLVRSGGLCLLGDPGSVVVASADRRSRSRARLGNQGSRVRGRGTAETSGADLTGSRSDATGADSRRLIIAVGGGWPNGGGEAPARTRMACRDASLRRLA